MYLIHGLVLRIPCRAVLTDLIWEHLISYFYFSSLPGAELSFYLEKFTNGVTISTMEYQSSLQIHNLHFMTHFSLS